MTIQMSKILIITFSLLFSITSWAFSSEKLVKDAKSQIGRTLLYDPAYSKLNYPMGDVPLYKGVCTDVVIRALRKQDIDLQKEIHEDMKKKLQNLSAKVGLKSTR